jgi:hypothetical protein
MKYYIIQEIGFEYNDEIYNASYGDNGTPVKVFKNKKDAQNQVELLNFKKFQDESLHHYAYSLDDIIDDIEEFVDELNKITGKKLTVGEIEDDYDFTLPKMSQEDFEKIKKYIHLNFYQVVECDGE